MGTGSNALTITVVPRPAELSAWVRLIGDVEMNAETALADTVGRLRTLAPGAVVVDLTAVTFACSTLVRFVAEVTEALPEADVTVHNPGPLTCRILALSGPATIRTTYD